MIEGTDSIFYFIITFSHHLLANYITNVCNERDTGAPLMMKQNNR